MEEIIRGGHWRGSLEGVHQRESPEWVIMHWRGSITKVGHLRESSEGINWIGHQCESPGEENQEKATNFIYAICQEKNVYVGLEILYSA